MKKDKLIDAFKAFEAKNLDIINGGLYKVTYQSGSGVCDLLDSASGTEYCGRKDTGPVGTVYK